MDGCKWSEEDFLKSRVPRHFFFDGCKWYKGEFLKSTVPRYFFFVKARIHVYLQAEKFLSYFVHNYQYVPASTEKFILLSLNKHKFAFTTAYFTMGVTWLIDVW